MAVLSIPRRGRWYNQPDPGSRLTSPYAERAEFFSLMYGEVFAQDIVKGNNLVPQAGSPTTSITPWGRSLRFDGSASHLRSTNNIANLTTFTVMAWVRPAALSTYYPAIVSNYFSGFFLGVNKDSKYAWIVNDSAFAAPEACIGGQQVVGQRDFVCGTFDGTNRLLYVNGALVGSSTATSPGAVNLQLNIGRLVGGQLWNGDIDTVGIFNGPFAASTIAQIYQDPWRMFMQPKRKLFLVQSGSGISLTVANASIAEIAATAAITQTHILSASAAAIPEIASTVAIGQTHILSVANSSIGFVAATPAISLGAAITLTVANSSIAFIAATSAVALTNNLTVANASIANVAASLAITQTQLLSVASAGIPFSAATVVLLVDTVVLTVSSASVQFGSSDVIVGVILNTNWVEDSNASSSWANAIPVTNTWSV